ncbi:MAG: YHS domain protein [Acidobacteria bacterium]|nr:YHS domain protein [Acidobacteriota bacterium]MBI3424683.1 YHS domain protein [Acidobacteriota bacterium]
MLKSNDWLKRFALAVAAFAVLPLGIGLAVVDPVNKNVFGTALKGYDTVAYFKEGRAVKGKDEFRHDWMGAKWYFADTANRDEFVKNPEQYAPQYGGYCAWAVGHGYTANIDPEAWKIVAGKLYLNYDKNVQKMWEQDIPGWIEKANGNWPKLKK